MRLPLGNLTDNDEENVIVFANHFKKVLNNHKPTDRTVINEINLWEVMEELDNPPLWTEYISAIQELETTSSPQNTPTQGRRRSECRKIRWSCNLAEEIHNMNFNPKEAWVSIGRLTGGELSYYKNRN